MSLFLYLNGSDLGNQRVRLGAISGFQMAAEMGSVSIASIPLDDPGANLSIQGWQTFNVDEPAATRRRIWTGYIADRSVRRGQGDSLITGSQRRHDTSITDANALLGMRVLQGSAANRPQETDTDRISWLLSTAQMAGISDYGAVSAAGFTLSASDFRGQFPIDVLNDMSGICARNFYVYADPSHSYALGLFYAPMDAAIRTSSLQVSNVLADVDQSTTFEPLVDAELFRDPSQLYSGIYYQYGSGGLIYEQDGTTLSNYFPNVSGGRDFAKTSTRVGKQATAQGQVDALLAMASTEQDRLKFTLKLPAAHVNDWLEGERAQVKFSHLPGYASYTYVRCVRRTVRQDEQSDAFYNVDYECVQGAGVQTGGSGGGGGSGGPGGGPPPTTPPWVPGSAHWWSGSFEWFAGPGAAGISSDSRQLFNGTNYNWEFSIDAASGAEFDVQAKVGSVESGYYPEFAGGHSGDYFGPWPLVVDGGPSGIFSGRSGQNFYVVGTVGWSGGSPRHMSCSFWVDPEGWDPGGPLVGQSVTEYATGDGTTTAGSPTNWPYLPGSLRIYVDGVLQSIIEDDPEAGTWHDVVAIPTGSLVEIDYLAAAGPATGTGNVYAAPVMPGPVGTLEVKELDGTPDITHASIIETPNGGLTNDSGKALLEYGQRRNGGQDVIKAHGNTGSTETFDPADGNIHTATLDANCTVSLTAPITGFGCTIELYLTQDATGSRLVTWPGSVTWTAGSAPTLQTAAGALDRILLETLDGGTTWHGDHVGSGSSVAIGTPALTFSTTNAAGSGTTAVGTGATVALFDATNPANIGAAAPGSAGVAARRDHVHAGALDDLSDVTITSPATADRLRYSGSAWVNSALIWRPVMTLDPTSGNYLPVTTGSGDAVIVEA